MSGEITTPDPRKVDMKIDIEKMFMNWARYDELVRDQPMKRWGWIRTVIDTGGSVTIRRVDGKIEMEAQIEESDQ